MGERTQGTRQLRQVQFYCTQSSATAAARAVSKCSALLSLAQALAPWSSLLNSRHSDIACSATRQSRSLTARAPGSCSRARGFQRTHSSSTIPDHAASSTATFHISLRSTHSPLYRCPLRSSSCDAFWSFSTPNRPFQG